MTHRHGPLCLLYTALLLAAAPVLANAASLQSGIASVYSGGRTANGETARASGMTAAHRSLPFGTLVRVTHKHNGRSVVVRINDRGPFTGGRLIDLSQAAAAELGLVRAGSGRVSLALLD